ncbi:MAG TPA: hypothetical protein VJA21_05335 [Verrucomicrobiae bacterium]
MNAARPIGFWYYPYGREEALPDPSALVCPGWVHAEEIKKLIAYLKAGATYETWRGLSYCRFRCLVDNREMGCRDFTDGLWVWPEGLNHYVERHDVRLPDDFVAHCRANKWVIPADAAARVELSHDLDFSSWIAWARSVQNSADPAVQRMGLRRAEKHGA